MNFSNIENYSVGDVVESIVSPEQGGDRYEILQLNNNLKKAKVRNLMTGLVEFTDYSYRRFELIKSTDKRYRVKTKLL